MRRYALACSAEPIGSLDEDEPDGLPGPSPWCVGRGCVGSMMTAILPNTLCFLFFDPGGRPGRCGMHLCSWSGTSASGASSLKSRLEVRGS